MSCRPWRRPAWCSRPIAASIMRNVRTRAEAIVPRLRSHVTGVNVSRHALDSHISTGPHYCGQVTSVEPARLLTAVEIIPRVCEYFGWAPMEHLTQHVA